MKLTVNLAEDAIITLKGKVGRTLVIQDCERYPLPPVSYTHLDVYKRQRRSWPRRWRKVCLTMRARWCVSI